MSHGMEEWPQRHRISVHDYYRMAEAGLLETRDRVELIQGEIVAMPPIGSRHSGKTSRLASLLHDAVGGRAIVRVQSPIRLDQHTEVQPDIAVVKLRGDYYESSHPSAVDVLLLVEVSDTTLRYDCDVKAPLYARYAIPEVWILDLQADLLHFCSAPTQGRYSTTLSQANAGLTKISSVPEISVDLKTLFAAARS